ncbi:alpha/beta fold hydrolase [Gemmatimonadota bacterium]
MRHLGRPSRRWPDLPRIFFVLILLTLSAGCGSDPTGPAGTTTERGDIVSVSEGSSFTVSQIDLILAGTGITLPFSPSYPVETHQVIYGSVDGSGDGLVVSGALFQPAGADGLPLLSLQHGTVASRTNVASTSPLLTIEGVVGLLLASMGYLVVAPDYPGFGVSEVRHPYMHAASLVPSVVDLLRAARLHAFEQGITLDGTVFLSGYSEGGYVTLAAQKTIEEDFAFEFHLAGVAPLGGPYDLVGMTQTIFSTGDYPSSAYIAYLLTAYDRIYRWYRLDEMVQPVYASSLPSLFDGSKTWAEVEGTLPDALAQLLLPSFMAGVVDGTETEVLAALTENTLLDWGPVAPIHFFHGTDDAIVPYQNALTAESRLNAHGAVSIEVTGIEGADHATAGPDAVIGAIQWFEFIRAGSGVRRRN